MKPSISIFMPAYNAAPYMRKVIGRIPPALWERLGSVWIVNDGSTDLTGAVAESLSRGNGIIRPVHFSRNRGYGVAVRQGLSLCKSDGCDFAACLHADGQYPPESILPFVDAMAANGIDLMQGSRLASGTALAGGMPIYKYIAGRLLTAIENRVLGLRLSDYHSGFLVYGRAALEALPFHLLSESFDFDLEAIAAARTRGLAISELPIPTRYAGETSHLNPATYGLRVLWALVKYKAGYYAR